MLNLRIYSPYKSKGRLFSRELSKAEIDEILIILEFEKYRKFQEGIIKKL